MAKKKKRKPEPRAVETTHSENHQKLIDRIGDYYERLTDGLEELEERFSAEVELPEEVSQPPNKPR